MKKEIPAMLKVEILSWTPDAEKLIEQAGRTCYKSKGRIKKGTKSEFIKNLIIRGHLSVLEHAYITIRLHGVSRVLTHQLIRHRLCSFSQQSQRYVGESKFSYIIPPEIAKNKEVERIFDETMNYLRGVYKKLISIGIKKEDARYVLPNSCTTEIVFSLNFRELRHILLLRGESKAQWEIREVMISILEKVKKIAPACFFDLTIDKEKRIIIRGC